MTGQHVTDAVQENLEDGKMLKQLNATVINFIPKVTKPENIGQVRPISCCNILYKCISKIQCKRLKTKLPLLVNISKGAFGQSRSLLYNVLMCHDNLRHYNRKHLLDI